MTICLFCDEVAQEEHSRLIYECFCLCSKGVKSNESCLIKTEEVNIINTFKWKRKERMKKRLKNQRKQSV